MSAPANTDVDVIVVGGGISGLAAAIARAERLTLAASSGSVGSK